MTEKMDSMRLLSPLRNSTSGESAEELAVEQLEHFGIDPNSEFGESLGKTVRHLYDTQSDISGLWAAGMGEMAQLSQADKINRFNSLKFLSFQLAKMLDTVQHPFRKSYQALGYSGETTASKGPYAVFDNVTAVFSATPVISRTATYIYACAEWIADAFKGKELMLEIYSRLLNPTSICLANHIVDLEAGPYASEYLAWNFNSGMAAIDATLSHVLGRDDVIITSRNIYGGAYQLINDWYAKPGNLDIAVEMFDGYTADEFSECLERTREKHADRLAKGRKIYVYLESPCNPHGYIVNVATICRRAHSEGLTVMLDATVGTPFLYRSLAREDATERPDYTIHSYTKDLSGSGGVIAGCVIGRNENMFMPKGMVTETNSWDQTMFWNVYYVKGAFLNADASFEVLQGMKTLTVRMLRKCINTIILAKFLDAHPSIDVTCSAVGDDMNSEFRERYMYLGLPAALFTISINDVSKAAFQRFFDALSPTFAHMISLGQTNTIVSCPSLTTHSELSDEALAQAGMSATTIRFAVGDESPADLITHLVHAARGTLDLESDFSSQFPSESETREMISEVYIDVHSRHVSHQAATLNFG